MFTINTRRVGKYLEAKISIYDITPDIGLLDATEARKLAAELLSASLELREHAESMGDDNGSEPNEPALPTASATLPQS